MSKVTKLSEFNTEDPKQLFNFDGTVIKILSEGDPSTKRPFKAQVLMEESGELITIATWAFNLSPIFNLAVDENNIYEFEGNATKYNDEISIRVGSISKTDNISSKKVLPDKVDAEKLKAEFKEIVNKGVHNAKLYNIVNNVLDIPEFYQRPAAKSVHHAFPGGLALHTMGVLKNAMNIYRSYSNKVSLELIIVGSIIHDVGKIYEYTNDSQFSYEGSFTSHIPFGIAMITEIAIKLGYRINDEVIMQLIGIISSHHGAIELGSPSLPSTLEALIVHYADEIDAGMEGALEAIMNLPEKTKSLPIKALNGAMIVKLNNKALLVNDNTEENQL